MERVVMLFEIPKTSVRIKVETIINPKQKNLKSNPSRKTGNIKAKKTKADPGSG